MVRVRVLLYPPPLLVMMRMPMMSLTVLQSLVPAVVPRLPRYSPCNSVQVRQ